MSVLFTTTEESKGEVEIGYAISTYEFDLEKRELRENQSFFLTNNSDTSQDLRMIHRGGIEDVKPLDYWNNDSDYELLWALCKAYNGRFSYSHKPRGVFHYLKNFYKDESSLFSDKDVVTFTTKPLEIAESEHKLKTYYVHDLKLYKEELGKNINEESIPFTSIKINNLPANKQVFYSLNMAVRGKSFDSLIGKYQIANIKGGNTLLEEIENNYLANVPADNSVWHTFFSEQISNKSKLIKPEKRDIFIRDRHKALPRFFKRSDLYKEVVENPEVAKEMAWFNASSPGQDFSLDVILNSKSVGVEEKTDNNKKEIKEGKVSLEDELWQGVIDLTPEETPENIARYHALRDRYNKEVSEAIAKKNKLQREAYLKYKDLRIFPRD